MILPSSARRPGIWMPGLLLTGLLLIGGGLWHGLQAQAPRRGAAPVSQVGSFVLPYNVSTSVSIVRDGFSHDGVKLDAPFKSWEQYGQNANVTVVITCAPLSNNQTRVVVIASSTDSGTAEFYRNDIRTFIVRQRIID